MKLFLDFDDFLFNTEKGLVPEFFGLLSRTSGCPMEDILRAYAHFTGAAYAHGEPYTLERHVEYLRAYGDFNEEEVIRAAYDFHRDVRRFLFPDAEPFLRKLSREDAYLLTYGADSFQNLKIDGAGVRASFKDVIITQSSKVEKIKNMKGRNYSEEELLVFGDNRCKYFEGAKEFGIVTVHLRRPTDKFNSEGCFGCDYTVENLQDFTKVLTGIK